MDIWQILMTPFSFLLKLFCDVFDSYGIALILFSGIVTVILFPMTLKGKRSMIKMNLISGELQAIKERCGSDQEKYNREVQEFYAKNNVSPFSGCGWSFVPLLILMPLYAIIRRPFKYLMGLTDAATEAVAAALGMSDFIIGGTDELTLAAMLNEGNMAAASAAAGSELFIINFDFFGMNLAATPNWKIWEGALEWGAIGLFLLPIISGVLSLVSTQLTTKLSKMNGTSNPDATANSTNRTMMITMPLISVWIGFTMPAGMCVYWIANSVLRMIQEVIMNVMLKDDYAKAIAEKEEQEKRLKEEEKERRRAAAERKAAAIAAGKKKKKQPTARDKGVIVTASRVGDREFARGRAYSPTRYPSQPYFDPDSLHPDKKKAREEEANAQAEESLLVTEAMEETAPAEAAETVDEAARDENGQA